MLVECSSQSLLSELAIKDGIPSEYVRRCFMTFCSQHRGRLRLPHLNEVTGSGSERIGNTDVDGLTLLRVIHESDAAGAQSLLRHYRRCSIGHAAGADPCATARHDRSG